MNSFNVYILYGGIKPFSKYSYFTTRSSSIISANNIDGRVRYKVYQGTNASMDETQSFVDLGNDLPAAVVLNNILTGNFNLNVNGKNMIVSQKILKNIYDLQTRNNSQTEQQLLADIETGFVKTQLDSFGQGGRRTKRRKSRRKSRRR
jgi:hypothetical protein